MSPASDVVALAAGAAAIGFGHTLLGPDHYLPFIALARSQRWSLARTVAVTLQCGLGHVAASLALGLLGVAGGFAVSRLDAVESHRAGWASWALVALGLAYTAWGIRHAYRHRHPHEHGLAEALGAGEPAAKAGGKGRAGAWALFIVFVLGPCEPLVPLLMFTAATGRPAATAVVAAAFVAATLVTMTAMVVLGVLGVGRLRIEGLERFAHALAGATILLCGVGIRWLGW